MCDKELIVAKQRIQKYVDAGFVVYDPIAECAKDLVHVQLLDKVAKQMAGVWVIALDADEFIVIDDPLVGVGQMAAWFEENSWPSVYLQWRLYGTSDIKTFDAATMGSVIESFEHRIPTRGQEQYMKKVPHLHIHKHKDTHSLPLVAPLICFWPRF
jgi:hypothetical protein